MDQSKPSNHPIPYLDINPDDYDAIFLAGGHDKGVREYLESKMLQSIIQYTQNWTNQRTAMHGIGFPTTIVSS